MTAVTSPELARQWAELEAERISLSMQQDALRADLGVVLQKQEVTTKELRTSIGPNIPQRLFDIGEGRVVMVSAARGVELVAMEKADAPK